MDDDGVAAFLRARVDEDETVAMATVEPRTWHPDLGHGGLHAVDQEHIARHDPARVLREVEANRALLASFEEAGQLDDDDTPQERALAMAVAEVMRMLILDRVRVYSDHPDYRPEWGP